MHTLLNRLTFRTKVFLTPALALVLFATFGVLTWGMLKAQERRLDVDFAGQLHIVKSIDEAERKLSEAHGALYRALSAVRINAKPEVVEKVLLARKNLLAETQIRLVEHIDEAALDELARGLRAKALDALRAYQTAAKDAAAGIDVDINLAEMSMQGADEKFQVLFGRLAEFGAQQNAFAEDLRKALSEALRATLTALVVALAAAIVLTLAVGVLVTRSITVRIRRAVTSVERVTNGDLAFKMESDGKDEVGMLLVSLERMRVALAETVSGIRNVAGNVELSSAEIAQGNADLSQRTEEQAASLEETASSMEELTSTVKQNVENAHQANQLAAGASKVAVKGGQVVGQVVATMSSINESSKKIADIISVIDGIAFQTNILALNAAVEAARAGEQGRGFAVVASEVRNLAQRSAAAAKEIKELITDSVSKVENGTHLVDQAGKTMEEIVAAVKRVTDIMAEVTAASQEQGSDIEQVNRAIAQMDQVTQQNAALVEEAAAAAESMQEQAQALTQAVTVFKLAHGAEQAHPTLIPTPLREGAGRFERAAGAHSKTERRGLGRATNVKRLPAAKGQPVHEPPKPVAAPRARAAGAANERQNL